MRTDTKVGVFEKAYHCTETYVDRLKLECDNESEKLRKLSDFIGSDKFKNLLESKKRLLYIQQKIMKDFVQVLYERIYEELPPLSNDCGGCNCAAQDPVKS